MVSLLVWLAFGAVAIPIVVAQLDATMVLYAVLSLTLVRMIPVAVATIGAGFDRDTVLFVGWFGPRGLASLVFALLAFEEAGVCRRRGALRHRGDRVPERARPWAQRRTAGHALREIRRRTGTRARRPSAGGTLSGLLRPTRVDARERPAETPSGTVTRPSTPACKQHPPLVDALVCLRQNGFRDPGW